MCQEYTGVFKSINHYEEYVVITLKFIFAIKSLGNVPFGSLYQSVNDHLRITGPKNGMRLLKRFKPRIFLFLNVEN